MRTVLTVIATVALLATGPADEPTGTAAATLTGQDGWVWLLAGLALGLIARTFWRRLRAAGEDA